VKVNLVNVGGSTVGSKTPTPFSSYGAMMILPSFAVTTPLYFLSVVEPVSKYSRLSVTGSNTATLSLK